MSATQRISFTPVTTIAAPKTTGVDLGLGTVVELTMTVSVGSGDVYLLWWHPESNAGLGSFYPNQNPGKCDAAVLSGKTHIRWIVDKDAYRLYQILVPVGVTVTEAFVQGIEV